MPALFPIANSNFHWLIQDVAGVPLTAGDATAINISVTEG